MAMTNAERQERFRLRKKAARLGIPEAGPPKMPTPPPPRHVGPRVPQVAPVVEMRPETPAEPPAPSLPAFDPMTPWSILPALSRKEVAQEMRDVLRFNARFPTEMTTAAVAAAKSWLAQYNIDYAVEREERKGPQANQAPTAIAPWFKQKAMGE